MTHNWRRAKSQPCSVGLFLAVSIAGGTLLSGCAIPLPTNTEGITDEQLLSIKLGQTNRAEVVAVLGEPNVIWETERVLVYKEGPNVRLLWIVPGNYSAAFFMTDLGEDVIIMRFDKSDRIERLERRAGFINGKFLRSWVAEKKQE